MTDAGREPLEADSEKARWAAEQARALVTSHFDEFIKDLSAPERDPAPLWNRLLGELLPELEDDPQAVAALVGCILNLTSASLAMVSVTTNTPPERTVENVVGAFADRGFTF